VQKIILANKSLRKHSVVWQEFCAFKAIAGQFGLEFHAYFSDTDQDEFKSISFTELASHLNDEGCRLIYYGMPSWNEFETYLPLTRSLNFYRALNFNDTQRFEVQKYLNLGVIDYILSNEIDFNYGVKKKLDTLSIETLAQNSDKLTQIMDLTR
jgi:hypothetical protein